MTALGKTLAFFVLLFSMVTGAMVVMVFLARTNWKNAYQSAADEVKVARAALSAEQERVKKEREDYEARLRALEQKNGALEKDILVLKTEQKNLEDQRSKLAVTTATESTNSTASTNEIEKLKRERDQMVAVITSRNGYIVKLEKSNLDFNNRAVQAEIQANALTQKVDSLMRLVEDQKRQLDDFRARGLTPDRGNTVRPAAVDVQGKVLEVAGGYATISLGRNHELKEGDTLQVYRLMPTPQWLGTLKVWKTDVNQSVGQFTPATRASTIKAGDTVDTKVLNR